MQGSRTPGGTRNASLNMLSLAVCWQLVTVNFTWQVPAVVVLGCSSLACSQWLVTRQTAACCAAPANNKFNLDLQENLLIKLILPQC